MSNMRRHAVAGLAALLAMAGIAAAQQQRFTPHIGYAYPAGGKQGTEFIVKVGGQFLDGVSEAHVSGAGVKVSLVEYIKPITQGQVNILRDLLERLMDRKMAVMRSRRPGGPATKATWTDQDEKQVEEIRKKLSTFVRRPSSPAIAESVMLKVTIDADAEPGNREIRVGSPAWMSNPLVFCIGQLAEFSEPAAGPRDVRDGGAPGNMGPDEVTVTIPSILNGQILPGDTDKYRFKATKGQKLVITASARELIPYIPDAVPGWFQATLTLYDAKGKEVAYDDDFRFNPDPVIYYEVPQDGEYLVEIKDSIYRGREDFVYRIAIGELPFITGIFPLGAKAGSPASVELTGWNLPVTKLEPDTKSAGSIALSVRSHGWASNRMPFMVDTLPECMEREPNNSPAGAQPVELPIIINGRIDQPGDWDVYKFEGRTGQEIVAEVYARRLNSPLDSVIKLTDSSGKQIAFNDDVEDKSAGLTTHHADSRFTVTIPSTGTYCLWIGDTQRKGGPEYAYRLRISPRRPDFDLRVVPSSIVVRGGATVPVTVWAIRKDGYAGDIALSLKGAPPGFSLGGAKIPGNQDQVRITLTAPQTPPREPIALTVEGKALVQGQEVVRRAVPAESMEQAFAYHHLVPADELLVAVSGRFASRNVVRLLTPTPIQIPMGRTARVVATLPANGFFGKIQLELSEAPEGITLAGTSPVRDGTEIVFKAEYGKAKPGLKGNLIVVAYAARQAENNKNGPRRFPIVTLPAIPFEVVGR